MTLHRLTFGALLLGASLDASADPPRAPMPLTLEADPAPDRVPERIVRGKRWSLFLGESAAVLLVPTVYYWSTTSLQKEDWELDWDWPSWELKLTSLDAIGLDTGVWVANALRHPYVGALSYQVGRANGYRSGGSTLMAFVSAAVWEYIVEFKEKVSLNDLVVNTMSGFLLGEPLFQLGRLADHPGTSRSRRVVATLASPLHRLHAAAGYASWARGPVPWTRFEAALGGGVGSHGATAREEVNLGIDLELVTDPRFGAPGSGTRWTPAGTFNRIAASVRADAVGEPSLRVQSSTTYGGSYTRDLDADGRGTDRFFGAAAGIDYDTRHLADEWDRFVVFHLIGPRLVLGSWGDTRASWEVGAYADLAMVQAHVFGPDLPFPPMPQTSVLQTRGYYYASGTTVASRLRAQRGPWSAVLDGRAHAMWSIDHLDRVEMNGGENDPHDVADQRLIGRATVGVEEKVLDVRLELSVEGVVRRGTWAAQQRQTEEVSGGLALVFGF